MIRPSQHLRDEHQELKPRIEQLRQIADQVGVMDSAELTEEVEQAREFLFGHLIPHAQAEDAVLYPMVSRLMGAPNALDSMRFEHRVIGGLASDLAGLIPAIRERGERASVQRDLRRLLYGLYAAVGMHFDTEEQVLLPLLDARLGPDETERFYRDLEGAAATAKASNGD